MNTSVCGVEINGVRYVREDSLSTTKPKGKRAVIVVDRGWIFAGDVTEENGRICLDRAVWVFRWESIGFVGVIKNPKQAGVDIRPMPVPVDIPKDAEIFRVPVDDQWGMP